MHHSKFHFSALLFFPTQFHIYCVTGVLHKAAYKQMIDITFVLKGIMFTLQIFLIHFISPVLLSFDAGEERSVFHSRAYCTVSHSVQEHQPNA